MSLLTIEPGKQQYTLKVTDTQTKQETIATYNDSPILTTDHDELIQYAASMTVHFGRSKMYTVCFVNTMYSMQARQDKEFTEAYERKFLHKAG